MTAYPVFAAPTPADRWCLASELPARHHADPVLVAVASVGGVRIDAAFEDTDAFLLFEKSSRRTCFVGRQCCPPQLREADPAARARLLAGCDVVLCTAISSACRELLDQLGIGCSLTHAGAAVDAAVSTVGSG